MIKKFLLATFLLLSSFSLAQAGTLSFTHASIIVLCTDANSARLLFQISQIRRPSMLEREEFSCYRVSAFGGTINSKIKSSLEQVSAIENDWEGDPMAVFKITIDPFQDGSTSWFIIYNPADLIGEEVHDGGIVVENKWEGPPMITLEFK